MNTILTKLLYLMEKQRDTVLVVIVAEQGSAPRGVGACMLVSASGRAAGTVGGGMAELVAVNYGKMLLREHRSTLKKFCLSPGADDELNCVCGGEITMYFQRIAWDDESWRELAGQALSKMEAHRKAHLVLDLTGGAPALADDDSQVCIRTDVRFSMPLPIGERVVIFGGGHCGQALVPILAGVGFRVTVYDDRPDYAAPALFPAAEQVVCGEFSNLRQTLTLTLEDYVVVMTSGHTHDFTVLEQVLRSPLAYVGVIGSRAKTASVNERLRGRGVPEQAIRRVHTPIGLAIGAVTPAEIAVSIAAEMIQIRAQYRKRAGTLTRSCPMH